MGAVGQRAKLYLRVVFLIGRQPSDIEGTRGNAFHWSIRCCGSRCFGSLGGLCHRQI